MLNGRFAEKNDIRTRAAHVTPVERLRGAARIAAAFALVSACSGRELGDDAFGAGGSQPCDILASCDASASDARRASMPAERTPDDPPSDPVREDDAGSPPETDASVEVESGPGAHQPRPEDSAAGVRPPDAVVVTDVNDSAAPPDSSPAVPTPAECLGQGLVFDGATHALVDRSVQDDFTLEAWIKTTASRGGNNYWNGLGIVAADVIGAANDFGMYVLNDTLTFGVGNPDTSIASTSIVTTGRWVHVAATRRRVTGQLQLFVNGVLEKSAIADNRDALSGAPALVLGGNTDREDFAGLMDEIRIWDIVRTPGEIASTMRQRLHGDEAGLVGYWRFEEAPGPSATDSSRRRSDASLRGMPAWVPSDALCTAVPQ